MGTIRVQIRQGYVDRPIEMQKLGHQRVGVRGVFFYQEGYPQTSNWMVVALPCHLLFTRNTPDKVLARCQEIYPQAFERERRVVDADKLDQTLLGIQVYYTAINWEKLMGMEYQHPEMFAMGVDPTFEVALPDNPEEGKPCNT